MKFAKPALSVDEQIALLQQRGMLITNLNEARHTLHHINYFRLRAYWLPFELGADGSGATVNPFQVHTFVQNTCFEAVLASYTFDQRLKLLLMDAIERVEIALRTHWAHKLALRYGSHAYLDAALFSNGQRHTKCLQTLQDEVGRSHETFIKHYRETYKDPALPPIWVACEVLTLGQLSQWLDNLKHRQDRQSVAQAFGFDEVVLCAFAHHLATVRNLCAHHSRVWNRKFTIKMKLPTRPANTLAWFNPAQDRKVYNTLLMLALLLDRISLHSNWKKRLVKLLATMPPGTPEAMGFPNGWQELPVWASAQKDIDHDLIQD